jgi:hypothetical protein
MHLRPRRAQGAARHLARAFARRFSIDKPDHNNL